MNSTDLNASLASLLASTTDGEVRVAASEIALPLQQLGVDSVTLLRFLVAVEDSFSIEWAADDPQAAFESIRSLSDYLQSKLMAQS